MKGCGRSFPAVVSSIQVAHFSGRFTMLHSIKLGISGFLATLVFISVLRASTPGSALERNLSQREMLTSFGGFVVPVPECCGFNQGCLFKNTYTQTCASLTGPGQSFCTQVTYYTGNNTQTCLGVDIPGATCKVSDPPNPQCSICYNCMWYTDPHTDQETCIQVGSCGSFSNPAFCYQSSQCNP